jgi:dolichol-phosphate mannosyltransferase
VNDRIVIIPTYNEKENVEKMVRKIISMPFEFDILIIDDGSPDGTAAIVRMLMKEYGSRLFLEERTGKLGLGTAYIHGFKWAIQRNYNYVFEMDCDFSHNPDDLIRLYEACSRDGADMSVGSRYIRGANVVNWPLGRIIMSYYASVYVRFVTGIRIKDTTAGFVCYTKRVLETIPLDEVKFSGYAFQIEMKFTALKCGFKIIEVPIVFTDRMEGTSKMSSGIFKEAIFGVLLMKWKSLFRTYPKISN